MLGPADSGGEIGAMDLPNPNADLSEFEVAMRRYSDERAALSRTGPIPRWHLLLALIKQTLKNRRPARQEAGISTWELFKDAWKTCAREEWLPITYYKFRLYRADRRLIANRFVPERTGVFVMKQLNDSGDVMILDDKVEFAAACDRFGLPHVETIAYFKAGEIVEKQTSGTALPQEDLFVKSADLRGGRGVQRWRYDALTTSYQHNGDSLNAEELIEQLRVRSKTGIKLPFWKLIRSLIPMLHRGHERKDAKPRPYMIQKELKNHDLMERFTNGALCTVRIVTARAVGGKPQVIIAVLRMPVGNSSVDNFSAGGLASPIDLETGRLGRAVYKDPRKPDADAHPDSGERIAGETLPFWDAMLALCLKAHCCFPNVATVGWDVAVTTDGPKLIEANPSWGVDVVQMAHGKPLGMTIWPELLMSHAGRRGAEWAK